MNRFIRTFSFLPILLLSACGARIKNLTEILGAQSEVAAPAALSLTWSLANDTSSIELTATPNRAATIYYAVYNTDPGVQTAAQVKAAALACANPCQDGGSFSAVPGGTQNSISGLAERERYTVYAVAEEDGELDTDANVKKYAGVLPRRNSMQGFATAQASGIGVGAIVRYYAYLPPGYYDNPTANYPVLMYIHGGGEVVNSAGNADALFVKMDQTPFSASIASGEDYPAIVVQPQCNSALWSCTNTNSTNYLAEVIDEVNATYRTNVKKFAVIGMSWGGSGALQLAYDYPEKISAVMPIAGGMYFRAATSVALCPKFATTEKVAIWAVNNTFDPWYNSAAITGGGGAYPGDIVSTITGNCVGQPDARFTEMSDNTTFPMNYHAHNILEVVLASAYFDYGNCTGGNAFKSWNGVTCAADSSPPAFRVTRLPQITTALQAASLALTGSTATFATVVDWLLYFEKP